MSTRMLEAVKSLLEDLGVDMEMLGGGISEETKLKTDLGLEGDDLTDFIMEVEEHYDISISDDAVEQAKTVGDVIKIVESNFK